jgi:hypothetical protein
MKTESFSFKNLRFEELQAKTNLVYVPDEFSSFNTCHASSVPYKLNILYCI